MINKMGIVNLELEKLHKNTYNALIIYPIPKTNDNVEGRLRARIDYINSTSIENLTEKDFIELKYVNSGARNRIISASHLDTMNNSSIPELYKISILE